MKKLEEVLAALEVKYGPIAKNYANPEGCDHFLYDDDCTWGCKGNAMGD